MVGTLPVSSVTPIVIVNNIYYCCVLDIPVGIIVAIIVIVTVVVALGIMFVLWLMKKRCEKGQRYIFAKQECFGSYASHNAWDRYMYIYKANHDCTFYILHPQYNTNMYVS